jgi:uncharacterized transporter YbjL
MLKIRLLAFGLILLGGFLVGYVEAMQAIAPSINGIVAGVVVSSPGLASTIEANITSYIQQSVTPTVLPYMGIGIAMVVGGSILVAVKDRKPKSKHQNAPVQSQPLVVKQQD